MNRQKATNKRQKITRRVLAGFCAVCIAMLQCFVLLPAVTDQAYAAENVTFRANYLSDGGSTIVAVQENKTYINGAERGDTGAVNDKGEPIKGYILSKVLKKADLDGSNVLVNGNPVSDTSKAWLVEDGSSWVLYDEAGEYVENVNMIEADLDKNPISITKVKASKSKPYKGEKVKISYNMDVDPFFEHSDEYKNNKSRILELQWKASNGNVSPESTTTNDKSGSFEITIKESGEVAISPESTDSDFSYLNDGSHTVTLSGKAPKLTVKPKSVSMTVGDFKSCTVKYNGETVSNSSCTWSSKSSSIATVTSGSIRAVKAGKTTVTVKYKGLSANVSVTVKERKTSSYSRSTYTPYRPSVRSSYTARTTGTGATTPTTATRPTETISTAAPSFQTISVKEVYLTPASQDPYQEDEWGDAWDDGEDWDDEDWDEEEDWDEDGVTFPAAAGSAAVAAAACGAGVVGRVRRFHVDMGPAAEDIESGAGGDGSADGPDADSEADAEDTGKAEGGTEKRSRNPFRKFRK
ncbi:MAG: Ig-like domain-containing protein [Firmicutes bacterium]|nr:Ig-like domain-containing protein [Bacillota bacterium]